MGGGVKNKCEVTISALGIFVQKMAPHSGIIYYRIYHHPAIFPHDGYSVPDRTGAAQ